MAQGDVLVFGQAKLDLGKKIHDLTADAVKLGLITSAVTPTPSTSDPRWGAGGGTNLSSSQVAAGGNYASGGPTLASSVWTLSVATVTFDAADLLISQNAGNPTNARWGVGYNNTAAGKQALFALDLGGVTDLTAGDFSVTWNASGIWYIA